MLTWRFSVWSTIVRGHGLFCGIQNSGRLICCDRCRNRSRSWACLIHTKPPFPYFSRRRQAGCILQSAELLLSNVAGYLPSSWCRAPTAMPARCSTAVRIKVTARGIRTCGGTFTDDESTFLHERRCCKRLGASTDNRDICFKPYTTAPRGRLGRFRLERSL